ncbi:MAG: valine--tRNA ligase [Baileyella intestinalis]|uniref:valine--tRNA ligase n=1 Tax=Baileyella intestinalis TaxID=2606709 RepID=UPI002A75DAB9|nr:valine--tRNA ligase [Baileyella intestinalis]MCI7685108.1 valine--tRNA ligase [Clostridiales bacterium]MDY2995101.1 valine--tRNA ligase [Baileyella intestinalis]
MKNLSKTYDPKAFEDRIYEMWEDTGSFNADVDRDKKPFTIVMPPPNITGQLHMGHALDQTLQDILIRYKRMEGYSALWVPGSDHASIATEVKVANKLKEETGKDKKEFTREEFLKYVWDWKKEYGGRITRQCRKLGDSCDWRRERFTMDEGCSRAVNEFFIRLYNKGMIYKGNRLINWCPSCKTTLSDAEVEHEDKQGKYWYFRYPGADGSQGIVVATSRPETMFGDVAIAVRPDDERYKDLIGKNVVLPLVGREIPVVGDEYPDPEKGTGAVKITPAHDPNDFEVGKRHNLEIMSCINDDATMNDLAGQYAGMDRYECRKAWVKALDEAGYLVKTEDKVIPVGECYRCHTVIEPMISDQWFVKMEELAKPAIEAAKNGDIKHVPARFEKVYLNWLNDIHDWCISRQLWWGHRIPAYYCDQCGETVVAAEMPEKCPKCGCTHLTQDEDVLDTWFSSGLWPFSTLGWPDKTPELDYFYPTSVMVTGYDIIFFWVVRMAFSALEVTGEAPFEYVFLHGLVRDEQGRKMSKSLGNGIDPLEVIDQVGADALRFMLCTGNTPGNDMRFIPGRLENSRNFANKLWNASRFTIMNLVGEDDQFLPMADQETAVLRDEDKWMLTRVNQAVKYITDSLDKFELGLAAQRVYDLIWNEYCDWYIELIKSRLYGTDEEDKKTARFVLQKVLKDLLKLLHPFMPFITEEIYGYLPKDPATKDNPNSLLIRAQWPVYDPEMDYGEAVYRIETAMEIIKAVRNIRAEADAAPGRKLTMEIRTSALADVIPEIQSYIRNMANITDIKVIPADATAADDAMTAAVKDAEILIPLQDLVDFDEEIKRLEKEQARLQSEVERVEKKLANKGFVNKAPEKVVQEEREKGEKYRDMLETVEKRLSVMKKQAEK